MEPQIEPIQPIQAEQLKKSPLSLPMILFLMLFLSLGLASFTFFQPKEVTQTVVVDEMGDWKTYRNEEYGFEFKYPKDWVIDYDDNGRVTALRLIEDTDIIIDNYNYGPGNIIGFYWRDDYLGNIDEYVDPIKLDPASISSKKDMLIGNRKATQIDAYVDNHWLSTYIPMDQSNILEILIPTYGPYNLFDYGLLENVYHKVISTFKFIDAPDISTWKTYRNEEYGFEVKIPEDWMVNNNPKYSMREFGELYFVSQETDSLFKEYIKNCETCEGDGGPNNYDVFFFSIPSGRDKEFGSVDIGGYKWDKYESWGLYATMNYEIYSNGNTYHFGMDTMGNTDEKILEKILSTFKFISTSTPDDSLLYEGLNWSKTRVESTDSILHDQFGKPINETSFGIYEGSISGNQKKYGQYSMSGYVYTATTSTEFVGNRAKFFGYYWPIESIWNFNGEYKSGSDFLYINGGGDCSGDSPTFDCQSYMKRDSDKFRLIQLILDSKDFSVDVVTVFISDEISFTEMMN